MTTTPDDDVRQQALTHLKAFSSRLLPGTIRRITTWKRLPRASRPELLAEIRQELAIDCLLHAEAIVAAPSEERHARWMRLADRFAHRQFVARPRLPPAPAAAPPEVATDVPPEFGNVQTMRNGRMNLRETAGRRGVHERVFRRQLAAVAERLGAGNEHHAFWCRRLGEALTGLAADLLRERAPLVLWPRPRRLPDPAARLLRLRRLVTHFPIRAATLPERAILRRWTKRRHFDDDAPRRLLADAVAVAPQDGAAWLWACEAHVVAGDLHAATSALRAARRFAGASSAAVVLARARVLEARHRLPAAMALLARAARRWPRHRQLAAIVASLPFAGS